MPRPSRYDAGRLADDSRIRRVVICSGKVYYDLEEERANAASTMSICFASSSFIRFREGR